MKWTDEHLQFKWNELANNSSSDEVNWSTSLVQMKWTDEHLQFKWNELANNSSSDEMNRWTSPVQMKWTCEYLQLKWNELANISSSDEVNWSTSPVQMKWTGEHLQFRWIWTVRTISAQWTEMELSHTYLLPPRHTDGIPMRLPKEWTVSFKIPIFIRLFWHSISLRHFFPLISRNIYTNSVTSASIASYLFHMIYKDIISHHFHCTSFIKQVYNTQVFV